MGGDSREVLRPVAGLTVRAPVGSRMPLDRNSLLGECGPSTASRCRLSSLRMTVGH